MMIPTKDSPSGGVIVSAAERRLTLQLLSYWERIRGNRAMPLESDINPDELSELWDDCFLIHESSMKQDDYNFVYLGNNIRMAISGGTDPLGVETSANLNIKRLLPGISRVMNNMTPVIEEGELANDLNQLVKYRQCMLPLGENNKVLAVFGGMRCKVYPNERAIQ